MMGKSNKGEIRNKNNSKSNKRIIRTDIRVLLKAKKVTKGVRGMPRLPEAKKGVTSCENLRGLANTNRSAGTRMGQPIASNRDIL
jgi:hypothetical protein